MVQSLGLEDLVQFPGRVAPDEVPGVVRMFDAYAIPRKPHKVCQLVSPLKPLEAMAAEVPVIVSDVSGIAEQVKHEITGLVFPAAQPQALSEQIQQLIKNQSLATQLCSNALEFVRQERTWQGVVQEIRREYGGFGAK